MTTSIAKLVDSHYRIHLGCYFTSVSYGAQSISVTSDIGGGIWNHTYLTNADEVLDHAPSTHFYVDSPLDPVTARPARWSSLQIFDVETWMMPAYGRNVGSKREGVTLHLAESRLERIEVLSTIENCFGESYRLATEAAMEEECRSIASVLHGS